jgi:predicted dehydrogenase
MTSIALSGAGAIAGVHALAARELGYPVVAVASRSRARAEKRATEMGARAVDYSDLPAGADVVVVATPPAQHTDGALAALAAGASVLLEKPLCRTLAEADRLCAADRAERIVYAENLAFAPVIAEFLGRARTLGPLTHLEARTLQSRPTWGGFLDPVWGGGVLFDLGVHPLALVVLVARASGNGAVESVRAELAGDATDTVADVWLTFGSGLRAHVIASWEGPEAGVWDLQASSRTAVLRADLRPHVSLEANGDLVRLPASRATIPQLDEFGYVEQIRTVVERHVAGGRSLMDVEFGRTMLEIVAACYVSARQGSEVPVPCGCDRDRTPWELWRA